MFGFFGKKPTAKGKLDLNNLRFWSMTYLMNHFFLIEQQRESDRALRKTNRDIERERRKLEDEERKLVFPYRFQTISCNF